MLLVGLGGFWLGRLSIAREAPAAAAASQEGVRLVEGNETPSQDVGEITEGSVVASKSGTKYHFPWCAGAQSIKEANKIWFASNTEARAAGYEPASNCKGLE